MPPINTKPFPPNINHSTHPHTQCTPTTSPLTTQELQYILNLNEQENKDEIETLFQKARTIRQEHFHNKIYLYGFIYLSTICRNECNFCYYRASNTRAPRYRKEPSEIVEAAVRLAESGVHLIDLTMGEDPHLLTQESNQKETFLNIIEKVKTKTKLPVMISPGVIPQDLIKEISQAGADWFACYQETHDPQFFTKLRPHQDYNQRYHVKKLAHAHNMLIEEGILVGVGETPTNIFPSFQAIEQLDAEQIRAMTFVPQHGTPMASLKQENHLKELLIIAIMRIKYPSKLIPASLDVEGLEGLKRRLNAGANVVTSIVPPLHGLAGVAQTSLDIDDSRRTIPSVTTVLKSCGLEPASPHEYFQQCQTYKKKIFPLHSIYRNKIV